MNKVRIIDLLNKIANGEQPQKIKYKDRIYEKDSPKALKKGYVCIDKYGDYHWLNSDVEIDDINNLNEEVKIIEEDKKIKKLAVNLWCDEDKTCKREMNEKINEIIDYINRGD